MCRFCDVVMRPADCKVDFPTIKPMPGVLLGFAQDGRTSPATARKNMRFFHFIRYEEKMPCWCIISCSGGYAKNLFRIRRLQPNVRKLFYLIVSSQGYSFKYCGQNIPVSECFRSKTTFKSWKKKINHLYVGLSSDPYMQRRFTLVHYLLKNLVIIPGM